MMQTICSHGDAPEAVEMIKLIRKRLKQEAIVVQPFVQQN
jgi:lactam utilization protein B